MATNFSQLFIILAISVPSILATDFFVGDDNGWTINFDYRAWTNGKLFQVGDRLVFNYTEGVHNVIAVNGTSFKKCEAPEGAEPLTSGNDIIALATPGRKWYICGVPNHCVNGQKVFITVLPQSSSPTAYPTPGPIPAVPTPVPAPAPFEEA